MEEENERLREENYRLRKELQKLKDKPHSSNGRIRVCFDTLSCAAKYSCWMKFLSDENIEPVVESTSSNNPLLLFYVIYITGPRMENMFDMHGYEAWRKKANNTVLVIFSHGNNPDAFVSNHVKLPTGLRSGTNLGSPNQISSALHFIFCGDIFDVTGCKLLDFPANHRNKKLLSDLIDSVRGEISVEVKDIGSAEMSSGLERKLSQPLVQRVPEVSVSGLIPRNFWPSVGPFDMMSTIYKLFVSLASPFIRKPP